MDIYTADYAEALADTLEDTDEGDGVHVAPSDKEICVLALRARAEALRAADIASEAA
jgi:hypothetical protein